MRSSLAFTLCLVAVVTATRDVDASIIFFSEDFSGPTIGSALVDADHAWTLDSGTIRRSSSTGAADRHYITTDYSAYDSIDFVAELAFTLTEVSGGMIHFIGLGSGASDPTYFNEPQDAVFLRIHTLNSASGIVSLATNTAAFSNLDTSQTVGQITVPNATHRVRLTQVADQLTFELDQAYSGTFVTDMSATITRPAYLTSGNTRLFFGTAGTVDRFDDLSVIGTAAVPEPASLALCSLGAMGLAFRVFRRRFTRA